MVVRLEINISDVQQLNFTCFYYSGLKTSYVVLAIKKKRMMPNARQKFNFRKVNNKINQSSSSSIKGLRFVNVFHKKKNRKALSMLNYFS